MMKQPDKFLSIVFHEFTADGDELGLCAGFERGEWREAQLADHVIEWLPEFCLTHSEMNEIGHHNAVRMIRRAANIVYKSEKYGSRGEFGEVLLHIAMRQVFKTIPAVSKIYYKSASNKTVEGFDAVHVVVGNDGLELWIGETKFYSDIDKAISDVCEEVIVHLGTDYLRSEFLLIRNKIDPAWPYADQLEALLDENTSLDDVFNRACIPILLTYNSNVVDKNASSSDEYLSSIREEISKSCQKLRDKISTRYEEKFESDVPITIHIILVPLKDKKSLVEALDARLKALQS